MLYKNKPFPSFSTLLINKWRHLLQGRGGDPRLQQAAKDLARSQEHIEFLQGKLRDYNHALVEGRDQERHANGQCASFLSVLTKG